jgi:hypothetical protein
MSGVSGATTGLAWLFAARNGFVLLADGAAGAAGQHLRQGNGG